ncbi:MAG: aconitate hydratase AcnA [Deltaproteobacteria bacterium]|nr:aconitate hydratase AcnA [Deltaproteobacteria bacterium]
MAATSRNSFGTRTTLHVGDRTVTIYDLTELERSGVAKLDRLPFSLKILLENLLRREDGVSVTAESIQALARWKPKDPDRPEIAFMPARVLLQDFTGVPVVVDLAAMRDAMTQLGGDPKKINPLQPAELVIDHSVQVDAFGSPTAMKTNAELEFERNRERYAFLRWGQSAFDNFKVVPPDTGIVHQVNLEFLARVVMTADGTGDHVAFPDTVVGTDSHTTMINGLGVLGWGVGGIEAEAAMLGQPVSMLIPDVVGVKLSGSLPEGVTATDLVLRVTEMLRKHGVVGKFVEFFGPGLGELPLADRATIANMAPEYGATCGIFPVDDETLRFLEFSGRDPADVRLVAAYMKAQGLYRTKDSPAPEYTDVLELDLGSIEPSLAGPRRPQDRVALPAVGKSFEDFRKTVVAATAAKKGGAADAPPKSVTIEIDGAPAELKDGAVAIAAITSCTNTSNPYVLVAAGLVAQKAVAKGLSVKPWVKTSLAPGSQVVTEYLAEAGLLSALEALKFHVVGYGCTTCIGNSGPLPEPVAKGIDDGDLVVAAVLSGNRNFEGRVHAQVRANYLASPPLVVAYALAGRVDLDLTKEPLATAPDGTAVFLKDIWPTSREVQETVRSSLSSESFRKTYGNVFAGDSRWRELAGTASDTYAWDANSTYVQNPPYFEGLAAEPGSVSDIRGARVLAVLGDSITTDHISPAGNIKASSPAGKYLQAKGVAPADFNSYGARRGNHEIMMRGTFANVRLKNLLAPGTEGGVTRHLPDGEGMSIYDAAMKYQAAGIPELVIAGKEYGSGSSRDWAAKGPALLGVKAVLAVSFERIHRTNLIGMGVLPLEFLPGEDREKHGLTGEETYDITGIESGLAPRKKLTILATAADGSSKMLQAVVRIDTPVELDYYRHGGILPYVLRSLAKAA